MRIEECDPSSMEVTGKAMITAVATARSRLKREECRRTKHDSAFSQWKVLTGPSDWEDYERGKEGAERYRTQNLPNCTSCAGVYEFGVAVWHGQTGRDSGKLDSDFIIPVYLGKSDNVRNRMQQYGREGAHLENANSNSRFNGSNEILAQTDPGLFREIFSKGFSLVYRWAPMKNTWDAERTESDLLNKFDYAWNKSSNGERRPNDILKKLKRFSNSKSLSLEKGLDFYSILETNGLLQRVFKFGRSQPRLVVRSGGDENYSSICGVALGRGVICKRPIEGNKRCAEHKGMKVNGFTSKLLTAGTSTLVADEKCCSEDFTPVCGVILDDGSSCRSKPLQGNKRCLAHKGRRICDSIPGEMKEKEGNYVYGPILDCNNQEHVSPSRAVEHFIKNGDRSVICGVDLVDGTFCTRQPPIGRKRCEEHKGMRIKETISEGSNRKEGQNRLSVPSVFCEKSSPTCGAALQNGSFCSRKPSEGNKRCWQHKSMRVVGSPGSSSVSDPKHCDRSSQYSSYGPVYEHSSSTCGAALQNGSFCSRKPTEGNKRCWQHYGMRVNASPGSCNKWSYGYSSRYALYNSVYENSSSTCGAPCRNGSYCSKKVTGGGRCFQHGG